MRRRVGGRTRSRRALDMLRQAHNQMEAADYAAAAEAFERLAARAPVRGGRHTPVLYLEAGRARILEGQTDQGIADLKSGFEVLAERGRWARFQRAGQRAVAELRQRGLQAEAGDLQAFLAARLPEGFGMAMAPGLRQRPLLPTHCPSCGGPVEPDMVEWMDDSTAECDYCGSPIRAGEWFPSTMIDAHLTEDYIVEQLRQIGSGPSSTGYAEIQVESPDLLKCAAVLVPLVFQDETWHLLYTRRAERMLSHQGQVSFPGGACDEGEATPEQTALREAHEEIGMQARDVRLLGRLNTMITITSYRVTPVVGVIPWPYVFRVQSTEVARVFTIPLLWLADARNRWEFPFPGRAQTLIAYHPYDGELLWGATARMTVDFLNMLGFK